jgi:hypothetical protein
MKNASSQRLIHFNKLLFCWKYTITNHISFLNDQVYFYCLPNLYIYLWPEKLQNRVTSFSEITMENDWWLLILRNHSQWKSVQWSRRSWKSCIPVWKKRFITVFFFSKLVSVNWSKKKTILKLGNPLKSKSKFIKSKMAKYQKT